MDIPLQCFDTVDWAARRASDLLNTESWCVAGVDVTGAWHVLAVAVITTSSHHLSAA